MDPLGLHCGCRHCSRPVLVVDDMAHGLLRRRKSGVREFYRRFTDARSVHRRMLSRRRLLHLRYLLYKESCNKVRQTRSKIIERLLISTRSWARRLPYHIIPYIVISAARRCRFPPGHLPIATGRLDTLHHVIIVLESWLHLDLCLAHQLRYKQKALRPHVPGECRLGLGCRALGTRHLRRSNR